MQCAQVDRNGRAQLLLDGPGRQAVLSTASCRQAAFTHLACNSPGGEAWSPKNAIKAQRRAHKVFNLPALLIGESKVYENCSNPKFHSP